MLVLKEILNILYGLSGLKIVGADIVEVAPGKLPSFLARVPSVDHSPTGYDTQGKIQFVSDLIAADHACP